jgi:hypothetical protein
MCGRENQGGTQEYGTHPAVFGHGPSLQNTSTCHARRGRFRNRFSSQRGCASDSS